MKTFNQFKIDMTKPGWMLKADPELAKKIKDKQELEKKRQDAYGDPSKGISIKQISNMTLLQQCEERLVKYSSFQTYAFGVGFI